jgi:hypothetical protein
VTDRKRAAARRHAWDPALLTEGEVASIKAIASSQRVGFEAIVYKICRFGEVSFAVGGEDGRRESDYAEGKRAVAKNLLDLVAMKLRPQTRGPEPGHVEPKSDEKPKG